jgi:hypothetical protein
MANNLGEQLRFQLFTTGTRTIPVAEAEPSWGKVYPRIEVHDRLRLSGCSHVCVRALLEILTK